MTIKNIRLNTQDGRYEENIEILLTQIPYLTTK